MILYSGSVLKFTDWICQLYLVLPTPCESLNNKNPNFLIGAFIFYKYLFYVILGQLKEIYP